MAEKIFAGFKKSQVDRELVWVVRHTSGYRFTGDFKQIREHCALYDDNNYDYYYDYIKDVDILAAQSPEMQQFVNAWHALEATAGLFITYPELWENYADAAE